MATLRELADRVGAKIAGDPDLQIRRVAAIDEAEEGDITFISNPKYRNQLLSTRASAIIVPSSVKPAGYNLLISRNPYLDFARILTHMQGPRPEARGVLPGAMIDSSARISENSTIHPGCIVGADVKVGRGSVLFPGVVLYEGVEIGEDCTLHAGVVVRERCRIGNRVIIQPSSVIGSDGFGFAPDGTRYFKIPQVGIVVIEDDVEIGAGSCIDRATLGKTRIGRGVKIDNLVQIAHNVDVGEDTIIVSQVGISGSTRIGKHCTFGGQSATAGHLSIGDNVTIAARGGVTNDVEPDRIMAGLPLMPHKEWLKATTSYARLPEIRKEISRMKRQLEELEKRIKKG